MKKVKDWLKNNLKDIWKTEGFILLIIFFALYFSILGLRKYHEGVKEKEYEEIRQEIQQNLEEQESVSGNTDTNELDVNNGTNEDEVSEDSIESEKVMDSPVTLDGYEVAEKKLVIPNISREYRFVVVNDMHIVSPEDLENSDNDVETLQGRLEMFSYDGKNSRDNWFEMASHLDELNADMIFFIGDMLDYYSEANFDALKQGLDSLETPYMYVRADYDVGAFWVNGVDEECITQNEVNLDGNSDVFVKEYDDLVILGINNNTGQLPAAAVEDVKNVFEIGKPIIMIAHVPFDSLVDKGLADSSREAWGDRVLLWGNKEYELYQPNENTQVLMELLYSENSPVVNVSSGHLHYSFDTMITDKTSEWVWDKSFGNRIGIVTVKP